MLTFHIHFPIPVNNFNFAHAAFPMILACLYHLSPMQIGTCNGVMRGLVNSLLPLFVRQLSADYARWSVDPEYRAVRAARSMPLSSAEY